jgi:hypothetical protein
VSLSQTLFGKGRLLLTDKTPELKAAFASALLDVGKPGQPLSRLETGGAESLTAFEYAVIGFAPYLSL